MPVLPDAVKPPIVCETSRLILRQFNESDLDSLLAFRGDPEVMRFSVTGPETREDIQTKYLPSCLRRYSRDGLGQWAVVRKSDGECIGECGICAQEVEGGREFEISYRMRRDCWGAGLATEAARACRYYGFKQAGLPCGSALLEAQFRRGHRRARSTASGKHVVMRGTDWFDAPRDSRSTFARVKTDGEGT